MACIAGTKIVRNQPFILHVITTMCDRAALVSLKNWLRTAILLLTATWIWCVELHAVSADRSAEIDKLMSTLYERGQFNGAILVAKQGEIIYRRGFGKANFQADTDFTPDTPSNIGSVTKQFTAMATMILADRNKLSYDAPVSKYIPEFSRSPHFTKITLRELLTHTSGLLDYGDLGIDDSGLDQKGLIEALLKKEDSLANPGLKYRYSNPGYALLAIVVERVSGKRFAEFLEHEIFNPVGMSSTFVYDSPRKRTAGAAVGYSQFGQVDDGGPTAIPGDGGIYSTVDDLFKWDQALYTEKLVRKSTLGEAYTPGRVEEGNSAYGFGWNVVEQGGGNKYVWHQGSSAGFRAFIGRRLTDRVTVIMLTNKGNSKRLDINAAIQNILTNKPYALPKQSGAEKLHKAIHDSGIQAALKVYNALKDGNEYDFGESELNTLGYQLLYGDKRVSDAVAVFKLNTTAYPGSSNAFDSLGEAYRSNGERNLAISSYKTAVKLDPANGHAVAMLRELELGPAFWLAVPSISAIGVVLAWAILLKRRSRKRIRSKAVGASPKQNARPNAPN
jgi:CubicO group peptidase (beta-lactamase class C family)